MGVVSVGADTHLHLDDFLVAVGRLAEVGDLFQQAVAVVLQRVRQLVELVRVVQSSIYHEVRVLLHCLCRPSLSTLKDVPIIFFIFYLRRNLFFFV